MPGLSTSEPAKAASESETPDEVRRWLLAPWKTPNSGGNKKRNKKGGANAGNNNNNGAEASSTGVN